MITSTYGTGYLGLSLVVDTFLSVFLLILELPKWKVGPKSTTNHFVDMLVHVSLSLELTIRNSEYLQDVSVYVDKHRSNNTG